MKLTEHQKERLAEALEEILTENFTSKPGWNFQVDCAQTECFNLMPPDERGKVVVSIIVERL